MLKRNTQKVHIHPMRANEGFSLVEVLVCIALIALICVPLFSGIRTSAILNNKAHYTQLVTAYAQEELENVKSLSVERYTAPYIAGGTVDGVTYTYVTSGTEWEALNDRATEIMNNMSPAVSLTAEQQKSLFEPFICEKKDIEISGKKYTMHVKFMPAE
ncbi:MAG: type II secretion system protein, partial [Lachnospiraceae bacterium]|nr:type II secretion system protein [Lachnospiraceae bacterium]